MRWYGLRLPVIIIILLASLAILLSGQWVYRQFSLTEPLDRELKGNADIKSFQVDSRKNVLDVIVSFNDNANLMDAYQGVYGDLKKVLGDRKFHLAVQDNRDDVLKKVLYKSQFVIYQAVAQGSFQDMAGFIEREAGEANVSAEIYIDYDYIYLRMKHEGHILDQVISRNKD